jgi:hypothetical protein
VLNSQGYLGFKEDWGRRLSFYAARGYSEEGAKIGSFAREIWGQGERDSFAQVVKRGMAGRGFRG